VTRNQTILFLIAGLAIAIPPAAIAGDAVLIEFASARCRPCQQMQPVLAELSRDGYAIRAVDVDQESELAQRYGIRQTPTFIVVSGGKELTRLVGMQSADELKSALAIDPSGPWIDTKSTPVDNPPMTRLAPLPTAMATMPTAMATTAPSYATPPSLMSEPMPSVALADAVQRAQAATVRLRVHDGKGHGAGTGTIIDNHGEESLVLTCGHLFRDTKGQGRIEVDLFVGGETKTVEGQLIDYDADDRDIALVAIRAGFPVRPVVVISNQDLPTAGDTAFSFGCDRGADPSRRDTRVLAINKYNQEKNASNVEIAGAPIDGRSGGGLFDGQGRLIGVCNAADYEGDIGIYAGPGAIHWQLDRIHMSKLYAGNEAGDDKDLVTFDDTIPAADGEFPGDRLASRGGRAAGTPASRSSMQSSADSEVIVIVRDRANPTGSPRVLTLDQPTPELLHMLESQATR